MKIEGDKSMVRNGLVLKYGLNTTELDEIIDLMKLCNQHDGILLKLNVDMLKNRQTDEMNDILYYENGRLIGFLGLYGFNSIEIEVSGMVHPDYRRRGVFQQLIKAASEEAIHRGIPKLLLICEHRSETGKLYIDSIGGTYSFSEYRMEYKKGQSIQPQSPRLELVRVRDEADQEAVVKLYNVGFGVPEENTRKRLIRELADPQRNLYVAKLNQEVIGKISLNLAEPGGVYIYGFVVFPEYRGKGYGREILSRIVRGLIEQGHPEIQLEVETKNLGALGLYESCGFSVAAGYDYYDYPVK